jgi:hypothetical protein
MTPSGGKRTTGAADFNKRVNILCTDAGFAKARDRRRLMETTLEGVPRSADRLAPSDEGLRRRGAALVRTGPWLEIQEGGGPTR